MKLKRCLEKGQLERFKRLCDHLVIKKGSPGVKLVEGCLSIKSYHDRIKKLHEEGYRILDNILVHCALLQRVGEGLLE